MGIYGGTTLFYGKVDDGSTDGPDYKTLTTGGKKYVYHKDGYLTSYSCISNLPSQSVIRAFKMTSAEYELSVPGFSWLYYYDGSDTYGDGPCCINSYSSDVKEVQLPDKSDKVNTQLEVFSVLKTIDKFRGYSIEHPYTGENLDKYILQFQEIKEFLIKHNENSLQDMYIKWVEKLDDGF